MLGHSSSICLVLYRLISKRWLYIFLDDAVKINKLSQPAVLESRSTEASTITKSLPNPELHRTELELLDLYSGCGGMSTGLCLGAKISSVNLVTVLYMDSIVVLKLFVSTNYIEYHLWYTDLLLFASLLRDGLLIVIDVQVKA